MHHSRDAHGGQGGNGSGDGRGGSGSDGDQNNNGGGGIGIRRARLRLATDDPANYPFPTNHAVPDEVIEDLEHHMERTQRKLDDLRKMLDPFPNHDDGDDWPPRAA